MADKKKSFTLEMPSTMKAQIENAAKAENLKSADIVRRAIQAYFDSISRKGKK